MRGGQAHTLECWIQLKAFTTSLNAVCVLTCFQSHSKVNPAVLIQLYFSAKFLRYSFLFQHLIYNWVISFKLLALRYSCLYNMILYVCHAYNIIQNVLYYMKKRVFFPQIVFNQISLGREADQSSGSCWCVSCWCFIYLTHINMRRHMYSTFVKWHMSESAKPKLSSRVSKSRQTCSLTWSNNKRDAEPHSVRMHCRKVVLLAKGQCQHTNMLAMKILTC